MAFFGKGLLVSPGTILPAYESVFHQGCKDLLKQFMLGMLAEIPLILVVYAEMKETEQYFMTKIIQAASKLPEKDRLYSCKFVEGFLDINILPKAIISC